MVMPDFYSYFLIVGIKFILGLIHIVGGEALKEVYIYKINEVSSEYHCCVVALLGRCDLQLVNETWSG